MITITSEKTQRNNVSTIDANDPVYSSTSVVDAYSNDSGVGKFISFGVSTNEILVKADFGSEESDTSKYIVCRALFKHISDTSNKKFWSNQFQLGGGLANFTGITPVYGYAIYIKIEEISAATTVSSITLQGVNRS